MAPYDPDRHRRRSIRWQGYDYSSAGAYFVTISVQGGLPLLGCVIDGRVELSPAGQMIAGLWAELPQRFPFVTLDAYVVMPDHLHGILILQSASAALPPPAAARAGRNMSQDQEPKSRAKGTPADSLGRVIQAFKSLSTLAYGDGVRNEGWPAYEGRLWQRNYYDRVVRNERELRAIREYIRRNPDNWAAGHDPRRPEA